jgi:hypothetical protein
VLLAIASVALAFDPPNSTVSVSAGLGGEALALGVRGEAWLGDELSGELGVTTDPDFAIFGADLALRWRPDIVCIACDRRALGTFGIGVGGFLTPDLQLEDPWQWAVGPDAIATFVYWFDTAHGLTVSVRGGGGPKFNGTEMDGAAGWGIGSVGFAF